MRSDSQIPDEDCLVSKKSVTRSTWSKRLAPPVFLLSLAVIWELLADYGLVSHILAPAPTKILGAIVASRSEILDHAWTTMQEVISGYAAGILIGCLLGVIIVYSSILDRIFTPFMIVSQTVPYVALAPILVAWFGYGMMPKLVLVALITFFPVALAIIDGLRSVDPELLRFVRSLGGTEWNIFSKLKLPSALPHVFTGVKVSATYAVLGAVVAELFGSRKGLGNMMMRAHTKMKTDLVFGTVGVMTAMGILLFLVVVLAERLVIPWHHARTKRS